MNEVNSLLYPSAIILSGLILTGCVTSSPPPKAFVLPEMSSEQARGNISGSESIFSSSYNQTPIHPDTRFFLIAAGADIANFTQEIVEQKKYWLNQGFDEQQIACYYIQPTSKALDEDRDQFESLASEVAGFRLASMQQVATDLTSISTQNPDFIYIYVTSHGAPPSYARKLAKQYSGGGKIAYERFLEEFPGADQYTVQFHSLPTGTADVLMQLHAQKRGIPHSHIHLSPAALWKLLEKFPESTVKFITLQACFSGGFVDARGRLKYHTAPEMAPPNLTVMTAARFDRPSFGCSPGNEKTEFGSAFLQALNSGNGSPLLRDWRAIFDEVQQEVERIEQTEPYSEFKPSHPSFYSNWRQWE